MQQLIELGIAQSIVFMGILFIVGWAVGAIFFGDEEDNDQDDYPPKPWKRRGDEN